MMICFIGSDCEVYMKALVIYLILCFIGSGITNMNTSADSAAAAEEPVCESVCEVVEYCEVEEAHVSDTAYDLSDEDMFVEEDQDTDDEPADDNESGVSASAVPVVKNTEVPVTVVSDPASDEDAEWDDDCDDDEDDDWDDEDWEDDQDRDDDQDIDDDDEDDGEPAELIPEWRLRDGDPDETIYPEPMRPWYVHNQVIFLADSEEEAQGVADEYGLTLESFSYGVAVLNTGDTDARDVVAYGRENGLTPVELNHIIYLDDPVERFQPIRWERHEIIDDDPDTDPGDDTVPDDDE